MEFKVLWYEGWGAVYRDGEKVIESDDSGDIYSYICEAAGVSLVADHDWMYELEDPDQFEDNFPNRYPEEAA